MRPPALAYSGSCMTRQQRFDVHPVPTSPWVISTRELGRSPGVMCRYRRQIPAPADFKLEIIGVAEGRPIQLRLRFESAIEGVFVSGSADVEVVGECARCLEPLSYPLTVSFGELFAYPDSVTDATTEPDEVSRVVDEMVDVEDLVRDAVLLALPLAPLCRDDCRGLCPDCGERWVDLDLGHSHETLDARWAALEGWLTSTDDADIV